MGVYSQVFGGMLLLSFGLFVFLSGAFTAYFGAGRSRKIGYGLGLVGLLVLFIFGAVTWGGVTVLEGVRATPAEIYQGVIAVIGATIGGGLAFALFLFSIMRA
ncbi:MAG: hypothetical protein ACT4PT_07140 [Methanobacteriota archaeon]